MLFFIFIFLQNVYFVKQKTAYFYFTKISKLFRSKIMYSNVNFKIYSKSSHLTRIKAFLLKQDTDNWCMILLSTS